MTSLPFSLPYTTSYVMLNVHAGAPMSVRCAS
jgi:hypothetical protein